MELSQSEKDDLRNVLEPIFGVQTVSYWHMNEKVLETTAQMFSAIQSCSQAMNLLPRPGAVDKNYLRRQLKNMAKRTATEKAQYEICRYAAGRNWKSAISLASEGI